MPILGSCGGEGNGARLRGKLSSCAADMLWSPVSDLRLDGVTQALMSALDAFALSPISTSPVFETLGEHTRSFTSAKRRQYTKRSAFTCVWTRTGAVFDVVLKRSPHGCVAGRLLDRAGRAAPRTPPSPAGGQKGQWTCCLNHNDAASGSSQTYPFF